jgi:hypothetical protein
MLDGNMYVGKNFTSAPCPFCGGMFSKCGLPNHIRRHKKLVTQKSAKDNLNRRSLAWWDGWKEGYKLGVQDGKNGARRKLSDERSSEIVDTKEHVGGSASCQPKPHGR